MIENVCVSMYVFVCQLLCYYFEACQEDVCFQLCDSVYTFDNLANSFLVMI